jgi:hypothetical protein
VRIVQDVPEQRFNLFTARIRTTIADSRLIASEYLVNQCLCQSPATWLGRAIDDDEDTANPIK